MIAQTATKLKGFTPQLKQVLSRPFLSPVSPFRLQGPAAEDGDRFTVYFTQSRRDILRAQRLRFRIFSDEYGAQIKAPFGLDRDRFDKHCLHLLVRDNDTGELVGYTRILTQERIAKTGGFYSAGEFDLGNLARLPGRVAEVGRTCIHKDYRSGAAISLLWAKIVQFALEEGIDYLIGCASLALGDDYDCQAICDTVRDKHLSEDSLRVMPRVPVPAGMLRAGGSTRMPPLLKAYLRLGADICGEPCWDAEFNCLDFLVLMPLERLPARYLQHFTQPRSGRGERLSRAI
ncbi:GNAT family N-acetyltransferase [Isoalcanivorax beigongshangi]|uniref:L-ornithine N(alpha)-acyltransferase n=1 Tax=Isoalcanivorax beigongshangi TaxID=3238810 RepID=A0ABV4AIF9_9GAMM